MKTMILKQALIGAAVLAGLTLGARGQALDVKTINFDMWCQETQHLPADRCDKRSAEDEAAFEEYRAKVEKYEIPYLQGRQTGAQLNRTILHSDPIDNPVSQDPSAAAQQSTSPANPPKPAGQ
jgi:hypothetical protein